MNKQTRQLAAVITVQNTSDSVKLKRIISQHSMCCYARSNSRLFR